MYYIQEVVGITLTMLKVVLSAIVLQHFNTALVVHELYNMSVVEQQQYK